MFVPTSDLAPAYLRGDVGMPIGVYRRKSLRKRFFRNVEKNGPVLTDVLGPCWMWKGARWSGGYGRICKTANGKLRWLASHRVSWELANGQIPDGMGILHRCDNPPRVRPDHLFLGTQKDNAIDMVRKARCFNTKKTSCHKGHPFSKENTYIYINRSYGTMARACRLCRRGIDLKYRMSKLEASK